MKTKILPVLLVLISIVFSQCKKYEEGPALSLHSKKHRVVGEWDVTEFFEDGQNVLSYDYFDFYQCNSGSHIGYTNEYRITRFTFEFTKDGRWNYQTVSSDKELNQFNTWQSCIAMYDYSSDTYAESGGWKFISGKEKIELTYDNGTPADDLEIIELHEKKMQLQGLMDGANVQITFEKR